MHPKISFIFPESSVTDFWPVPTMVAGAVLEFLTSQLGCPPHCMAGLLPNFYPLLTDTRQEEIYGISGVLLSVIYCVKGQI